MSKWKVPPSVFMKGIELDVRKVIVNALKRTGADWLLEAHRRIAKGRNSDNQRFAPYEQSTIKAKVRKGHSTQVNLQDTSSMVNSLMIHDDTKNLKIGIGVTGIDAQGKSNVRKMLYLERHKNYHILKVSRSWKLFLFKKLRNYITFS